MTTEIALFNRRSVMLAADSAVGVSDSGSTVIAPPALDDFRQQFSAVEPHDLCGRRIELWIE